MLGGAALGAITDLGAQAVENVVNGCAPLNDIKWGRVATSAAIGGATSALGVGASAGRVASAANSSLASVRAAGRAGETMAGIVKNTTRIPSASGRAAYRIPDELNSSVLGEVKNVAHLNYTSQLRDFATYAQQNDLTFTLYTRASTTFSSNLRTEIDAGRIILDVTRLGP